MGALQAERQISRTAAWRAHFVVALRASPHPAADLDLRRVRIAGRQKEPVGAAAWFAPRPRDRMRGQVDGVQ